MSLGLVRIRSAFVVALLLGTPAAFCTLLIASTDNASGYSNVNGNQELMVDPSRPLLYYADPFGSTLTFLNTDTNSSYVIEVGSAPMSIDISLDGAFLYVAVSGAYKIVVVDIELREVCREIPLDFSPLSVRIGRPDRLYVSSLIEDRRLIRIIDTDTGEVKNNIDFSYKGVVEVSPDGNILIAAALDNIPVHVKKYSITTDNPELLVEDDSIIGEAFLQMVPDWDNGRLYLASVWPKGIAVVSMDSLDMVEVLPMNDFPRALSLALDSSIVCGTNGGPYPALSIFNTTTGQRLAQASAPSVTPCALSGDLSCIFLGPQLLRVNLGPTCDTMTPAPGSVLGYSPRYVSFVIRQGILYPAPLAMNITVDGSEYEVVANEMYGYYRFCAILSSDLAIGSHEVSVPIPLPHSVNWCNWSFFVDPESEIARSPSISFCDPYPDASIASAPLEVRACLDMPDPPPRVYEVTIAVDGTSLTATRDPDAYGYEFTTTELNLSIGMHEATASIAWNLGNDTCTWLFMMRVWPTITPIYPLEGTLLLETVECATAMVDLGTPEVNVTEMRLSVNENSWPAWQWENNSVNIDFETPLGPGIYTIAVEIDTDLGVICRTWTFEISCVASMKVYSHPNGYNISLPTAWDVDMDEEVSGSIFDFVVIGPIHDNFVTNILVISDNSSKVEESIEFLQLQYEEALVELEEDGIDVTVTEAGCFKLSNHWVMEFTIEWDNQNIKQKALLFPDEEIQRLIVVTCSSSKQAYQNLEIVFDTIIQSIYIRTIEEEAEIPNDEDDENHDNGDSLLSFNDATFIILTIIAVAATAIITALTIIARRRRPPISSAILQEPTPSDTDPDNHEPSQ